MRKRKNITKRIISLLITLVMIFTMLPAMTLPVSAATAAPTNAALNFNPGQTHAAANVTYTGSGGGTAHWDGTNTLTLNNFVHSTSGERVIAIPVGSTINLIGNNTLTNTSNANVDCILVGPDRSNGGNLTITGAGSLSITHTRDGGAASVNGIGSSTGTLTIRDTTVNIAVGQSNSLGPSSAIHYMGVIDIIDSNVTVSSAGSITGGSLNSNGINGNNINITGSTVNATAGTATGNSFGISSFGTNVFTITNSAVTAAGHTGGFNKQPTTISGTYLAQHSTNFDGTAATPPAASYSHAAGQRWVRINYIFICCDGTSCCGADCIRVGVGECCELPAYWESWQELSSSNMTGAVDLNNANRKVTSDVTITRQALASNDTSQLGTLHIQNTVTIYIAPGKTLTVIGADRTDPSDSVLEVELVVVMRE